MKTYYIFITLFIILINAVNASESSLSDQELFDKASHLNDKGNHDEAFKIYSLLADKGYAGAENNLGYMYKSSVGTEQNYEKADITSLQYFTSFQRRRRYQLPGTCEHAGLSFFLHQHR